MNLVRLPSADLDVSVSTPGPRPAASAWIRRSLCLHSTGASCGGRWTAPHPWSQGALRPRPPSFCGIHVAHPPPVSLPAPTAPTGFSVRVSSSDGVLEGSSRWTTLFNLQIVAPQQTSPGIGSSPGPSTRSVFSDLSMDDHDPNIQENQRFSGQRPSSARRRCNFNESSTRHGRGRVDL